MGGIGLIRLRIGITGEPLWMRHWASGFHKPWVSEWVSEWIKYLYFWEWGRVPIGKSKRGCEDKFRIDLKAIGINVRSFINSVQDMDYSKLYMNEALCHRITQIMELIIHFVYQNRNKREKLVTIKWDLQMRCINKHTDTNYTFRHSRKSFSIRREQIYVNTQ